MQSNQTQTPQIYSGSEHPSSYIHYPRCHLRFLLYSILEYSRLILHKLTTQTSMAFQRPINQTLLLHRVYQQPYCFSETHKPNLDFTPGLPIILWFYGDPQTKSWFYIEITNNHVVLRRSINQTLVLHWDYQQLYGFLKIHQPN